MPAPVTRLAVLGVLALGCGGGGPSSSDAGHDAEAIDTGLADRPADSGPGDGGPGDGGPGDSGPGDGGVVALNCNQVGNWLGDFDGDGVADCARAQAGTGTRLDLVFNKGIAAGLFGASGVITPDIVPPNYAQLAVFDLNHDSRQDIIVTLPDNQAIGYSSLQLFRGQADGTFLGFTPATGHDGLGGVQGSQFVNETTPAADFDGDGYPDLLAIPAIPNLYSHFFWVVIKSSGGLDFEYVESDAFPSLRGVPVVDGVADLNRDGKLDLVALAQANPIPTVTSYVAISFGAGGGSFTGTAVTVSGTDGATGVSVQDINSDGKLDLLVTLPAGPTPFYGDGAGSFSTTAP
jgi:hypothetical protein